MGADGALIRRPPTAELQVGAIHPYDAPQAAVLSVVLEGRGLTTIVNPGIIPAIWDRFCFSAAAAAVNVQTRLSLRDAVPPTYRIKVLDRLLGGGQDRRSAALSV
ncbi:MAG: hypothetical protein AB7E81_22310 [Hyphomicrobiaceae bacterium]